ncbi:MaoC family dehydratase [Streptomyces sp. ODS28]|uniref:MaoC family dehydratase n=1 Tax=Streptomyces sp. ODS28 TaxID=3136688 RepID=UPI0031ED4B45
MGSEGWFFEDYEDGTAYEYEETVTLGEADIIGFAERFDPQYFHTDPEAAEEGPFGGLSASGWHTAGLMMRLLARNFLSSASSLGSPGVDELRWHRPVRAGDVLHLRVTVTDKRLSRSDPTRGIMRSNVELLGQDNAPVLTMTAINFLRTRP